MSFLKVSSLAIAATLFAGSAFAADLIVADPVVDMASPKAYDTHIGLTASIGSDGTIYGGVGVVIGADVDVSDTVFVGGELRGSAFFNGGGYLGAEVDALARLGLHASDTVDLYLTGGVGYWAPSAGGGNGVYLLGAGAEFDLTGDMALRTELLGSGAFGGGFTDGLATVGLLWKF